MSSRKLSPRKLSSRKSLPWRFAAAQLIAAVALAANPGCTFYQQLDAESDAGSSSADARRFALDADLSNSCVSPLPRAAPGTVVVCGQLFDTESQRAIDFGGAEQCRPCRAGDLRGPCSLRLRPFDALSYAQNHLTSQPLPSSVQVFENGEYCVVDIPTPATGFVALEVDDAASAVTDEYTPTTLLFGSAPGSSLRRRAFATRTESVERWTTAAGAPFGASSFADKGVLLGLFTNSGQGIANVEITENDQVQPIESYYFSDSASGLSAIDRTRTATASSGAVLLVNSELVNHSGRGNEPAGCEWPSVLSATIADVVVVQSFSARDTIGGEECRAP